MADIITQTVKGYETSTHQIIPFSDLELLTLDTNVDFRNTQGSGNQTRIFNAYKVKKEKEAAEFANEAGIDFVRVTISELYFGNLGTYFTIKYYYNKKN